MAGVGRRHEARKGKKAAGPTLRPTGPIHGYDLSAVPRNDRGGVLVTEDEIAAAFEFFDLDGTGKITAANLKKRLSVFYKDMPSKEFRFLMNNKSELTIDDLRELLIDNEVSNFDPVAEAFKVYDPHGSGFVDPGVLRDIFQHLGFGEISEEDLHILIETADVDQDGKISLNDFRKMMDFGKHDDALDAEQLGGSVDEAGGAGRESSPHATAVERPLDERDKPEEPEDH